MAAFFQRAKPRQSPQQPPPQDAASYRRSTAYTTDQVQELLDLFPEAAHLRIRLEQQQNLESLFQDTLDYLAEHLGNSHTVVAEFLKRRNKNLRDHKLKVHHPQVVDTSMKVRFQDDEARALKYLEDQCLLPPSPQHKQLKQSPRRREKQRAETPFVPKNPENNKLSQGLLWNASSCIPTSHSSCRTSPRRGRSRSTNQRHPRQEMRRDQRSPAGNSRRRRSASSPRQPSEHEVRDGPSPIPYLQQPNDPGVLHQQQHQQRMAYSAVNYAEDDAHIPTYPQHKKEGSYPLHNNNSSDRQNATYRSMSPQRNINGNHLNEDNHVGIPEIRGSQVSWDVADRQEEEQDYFSGIPTNRSRSLSPHPRGRVQSDLGDIARQRSLSVGSHHSRDSNNSHGLTSILSHAPRYQTKSAPVLLKQQRPICMDPLDHGHGERYPHSRTNSPNRSKSRNNSPNNQKSRNSRAHSPEQRQKASRSPSASNLENQVYEDEEERFIRERLARSRSATLSNPILVASVSSSSLDRFDAVPTLATESSYEYQQHQHQQQQQQTYDSSAVDLRISHSSSFEGSQHRRHRRYPKKEEAWVTPIVELEERPLSPISSNASSVSVLDVKLDTITGSNHSYRSDHPQQHQYTEDMLRQSRSVPLINNSSSLASSDPASREQQRSNASSSQKSFPQAGPQKHGSIGSSRAEPNHFSTVPPMHHQRSAASSDRWLLEADNLKHPSAGNSSVEFDPLMNVSSLTSYYSSIQMEHQENDLSGYQHYAEEEAINDASLRRSNPQSGSFANASRSSSGRSTERQESAASRSYQPLQPGPHTNTPPGYSASPLYRDIPPRNAPSLQSTTRTSEKSASSPSMSEVQLDIHQQRRDRKSRSTGRISRTHSSYRKEFTKNAVTRAPPFPESKVSAPKFEVDGLKTSRAPSHSLSASRPQSASDVHDLACTSSDGSLSSLIHSIKQSAQQTINTPKQNPRSDPPASASCEILSTRNSDDRSAYGPTRDPVQKTAKPQRESRKSRPKAHQKTEVEQVIGSHRPEEHKQNDKMVMGHSNSEKAIKKPMDPPSVKTRKTIEPPSSSGHGNKSRKSRSKNKKSPPKVLGLAPSGDFQSSRSGNTSKHHSVFLAPRVQSASEAIGLQQRSNESSILGSKRFDIRSRDSDEKSGFISKGIGQQSRGSSGIKSLLRAASSGDDEPSHKEKLLTSKPTERTNTTTGVVYSQRRNGGMMGTRMIHNSDSTISTLSENHEFLPQEQQGHVLSLRERRALCASKSELTDNKTPYFRQIKQMESNRSDVLHWAATNQSSVMFEKPASRSHLASHRDDGDDDDHDGASLGSYKSSGSESSSSTAIEEIIARCQRKLVYNRAPKRN